MHHRYLIRIIATVFLFIFVLDGYFSTAVGKTCTMKRIMKRGLPWSIHGTHKRDITQQSNVVPIWILRRRKASQSITHNYMHQRFNISDACEVVANWVQSSCDIVREWSQIATFMGPTWGPPGSCRPQMGPMLAPWTLLSGIASHRFLWHIIIHPCPYFNDGLTERRWSYGIDE